MEKYYYPIVSSLLLVLSLLAFSDNLFWDIGQQSNSDPKFIIHGLFMLAWFITFVVQSFFIFKKNYKAHMKWGRIGFLIAIGVFLSTVYVFIAVFKGWDAMQPFVRANRFFMLSFAVFLLLAYRYRKTKNYHKRFIFWAIALPIEPIIGRVSDLFQIENWELFYILVWHAFFISFFIYDWKTLKRIHVISWVGLGWFYVAWAISFVT
ncbi:hypothetical protein J0X14_10740 [Muricauda sp. CAU 1633]|uniref:hypothetical protein n=1 Tax=Allomuricauda sp. CAU 1633 TaxID=2816036 RepID=UPI001A8C2164|nr:hypothetical protein [Muricauda sp. CAU 1633]MBO0322775.1 hypothetical protein [Muricauda sp. CAU 1633]